jgi:hypothetical protein
MPHGFPLAEHPRRHALVRVFALATRMKLIPSHGLLRFCTASNLLSTTAMVHHSPSLGGVKHVETKAMEATSGSMRACDAATEDFEARSEVLAEEVIPPVSNGGLSARRCSLWSQASPQERALFAPFAGMALVNLPGLLISWFMFQNPQYSPFPEPAHSRRMMIHFFSQLVGNTVFFYIARRFLSWGPTSPNLAQSDEGNDSRLPSLEKSVVSLA